MKHLPAKAIFNDKLRNRLELKSGTDLLRAVAFATATCPTLKVDNDNEVYWGCGEAVSTTESCLFEFIPSGFASPTLRVGDEWKFVGMCATFVALRVRGFQPLRRVEICWNVPHSWHYVSEAFSLCDEWKFVGMCATFVALRVPSGFASQVTINWCFLKYYRKNNSFFI